MDNNTQGLLQELEQLSTTDLIQIMNCLDNTSFPDDSILRVWNDKYFNGIPFPLFISTIMWKVLAIEFASRLIQS